MAPYCKALAPCTCTVRMPGCHGSSAFHIGPYATKMNFLLGPLLVAQMTFEWLYLCIPSLKCRYCSWQKLWILFFTTRNKREFSYPCKALKYLWYEAIWSGACCCHLYALLLANLVVCPFYFLKVIHFVCLPVACCQVFAGLWSVSVPGRLLLSFVTQRGPISPLGMWLTACYIPYIPSKKKKNDVIK